MPKTQATLLGMNFCFILVDAFCWVQFRASEKTAIRCCSENLHTMGFLN